MAYNSLLSNFKLNLNFFLVFGFYLPKYNWIDRFEKSNINIIFLKNNQLFSNNYINYNENNLNDIVMLKKRSSMFKKNNDKNSIIFNKITSNKNNFNKFFFTNSIQTTYYTHKNILPNFFKNFDLSTNFKPTIKLNRFIIKDFYKLKYYRNHNLNKNLRKYNNLNKKNLINFLENRLFMVLIKSDFFFNYSDCMWFIKNKLVSVNSNLILDSNSILKPFDIVNVLHTNYYYNFYKFSLDFVINKVPKINQKVWLINKSKNKKNLIKYPKWMDNFKYFKKDIPINLEVDYLTMTIIVLNYGFNFKNLDFYNYRFINLYLNRLYNWKFIN